MTDYLDLIGNDNIDEWKRDRIEKHRESGHRYVVFEHHLETPVGNFQFEIESGGYEDAFPDWRLDKENVEVYDTQEDKYVKTDMDQS